MALLLRPLLLEALTPLALALERQDQLLLETLQGQTGLLVRHQADLTGLLTEVLNSLQPRPETEIDRLLGPPVRRI